jgi:site-specific DNA-cytosine methylase
VRRAFRDKGHEAWSCDIIPSLDDSPYHYTGDVIPLLEKDFDLVIAHPPCTALCVSGNRYYAGTPAREDAIDFFRLFLNCKAQRVCVENPVGVISTAIEKPTQYIQPWMFGHSESKKTGLWLKGLPSLAPTSILKKPTCGYWMNQTPSGQNKLGPTSDRASIRSTTYSGIAAAMADQWG